MTPDMTWVDSIIQVATAGGFSALVWYLLVKHVPAIEERHREDRRQWAESLERMHMETVQRMDAISKRVSDAIDKLEAK